jgi:ketosteroid isomerase-like protein
MVVTGADEAAVRDVLERVRSGWERMDAEAVLSCFERAAGTVVIGTDEPEYWIGYAAFEGPFRQMTEAFTDAEYHWAEGEPLVEVDGHVAWSTGRLTARFASESSHAELAMRTTHVLRRSADGVWRIVQGHYSLAAAEPTGY